MGKRENRSSNNTEGRKRRKTTSEKRIEENEGEEEVEEQQEEVEEAEEEQNVMRKGYKPQYRCTLKGIDALYKEIKQYIKPAHRRAMKQTPFKLFFNALHEGEILIARKNNDMMDAFINAYDEKKEMFQFGSGYYKPTILDVKLIFGIRDGEDDVGAITDHGRGETELEKRHFQGIDRISALIVKEKIKELVMEENQECIDDTVKLLCVVLLHTIFFANTGAYIAWGFLYYVDDFDTLNSFNWSKHILDELMDGLNSKWAHPTQVKGCTLFLLYWFCEHSGKIESRFKQKAGTSKKGVEGLSSKGIPRITKWDIKSLAKLVKTGVLRNKNDNQLFNKRELKPTLSERSLIWKASEVEDEEDTKSSSSTEDDVTAFMLKKRKNQGESSADNEPIDDNSEEGPLEANAGKQLVEFQHAGDISEGNDPIAEHYSGGKQIPEEDMPSFTLLTPTPPEADSYNDDQIAPNNNDQSTEKASRPGKENQSMVEETTKQSLEHQISTLQAAVESLNREKVDLISKYERTKQSWDELQEIVDKIKQENTDLIAKQEEMAAERKDMQEALEKAISIRNKSICDLENMKLASSTLKKEAGQFRQDIEKLEADKEKLQNYITSYVDSHGSNSGEQELIKQREEDQKRIQSLQEKVDQLERERAHLYNTPPLQKIVGLKDKSSEEKDKIITELQEEVQSLNDTIIEKHVHQVTQEAQEGQEHVHQARDNKAEKNKKGSIIRRVQQEPRERKPVKRVEFDCPDIGKGKKKKKVETVNLDDYVPPEDNEHINYTLVLKERRQDYRCGEYIFDEAFNKIREFNEKGGRSEEIWAKSWGDLPTVTVNSLVNIINQLFIDERVIDAIIIMMQRDNVALPKHHIILSEPLGYFLARQGKEHEMPKEMITDIVKHIHEGDTVYFPICSGGRSDVGNHWVLLTYNHQEGKWKMYHSLSVRGHDYYTRGCETIQRYVWKNMFPDEAKKPKKQQTIPTKVQKVKDIPLQREDTSDCAIYMLYYLHKLVTGHQIEKTLTDEKVQELKGMVVNSIALDTLMFIP